jgi:hypothetical protein
MADLQSQQLGHERRAVNVRVVLWFAAGLVVAAVIMHAGLAWLYVIFKNHHPSPEAPSRVVLEPRVIAPEPRLQTNPTTDLEKFRIEEEAKLNSYGWIDRQHAVARIPIERAIDLIAQRGLPTRGANTENSSGKTPEQMRQDKAAASAQQLRGER